MGKKCGSGQGIVTTEPLQQDTGSGVIPGSNGVFSACTRRTGICAYACCHFGDMGNFIAAVPGEIEEATEIGLKFNHLEVTENHTDGSSTISCSRPCRHGDFKPIDCMIYPLFPANEECTRFIVADHRKCPIPDRELIGHAYWVQKICLEREERVPGTLSSMIAHGRSFKGYQAWSYEILECDGSDAASPRLLTKPELEAISPASTLDEDHHIDWPIAHAIRKHHSVSSDGCDDSLWTTIRHLNPEVSETIRNGMSEGDTLLDWLSRYSAKGTPEDHALPYGD